MGILILKLFETLHTVVDKDIAIYTSTSFPILLLFLYLTPSLNIKGYSAQALRVGTITLSLNAKKMYYIMFL